MLHIRVVCVGKLKEKYLREAEAEYAKRLRAYCNLRITEVKDERPREDTLRGEEMARRLEGDRLTAYFKGIVIACDPRGTTFTSEGFSSYLEGVSLTGESHATFVIGGSTGLSEAVHARADVRMSFSRMTMPHRLFRIVLLEQIYRAFRIARGETYHK